VPWVAVVFIAHWLGKSSLQGGPIPWDRVVPSSEGPTANHHDGQNIDVLPLPRRMLTGQAGASTTEIPQAIPSVSRIAEMASKDAANNVSAATVVPGATTVSLPVPGDQTRKAATLDENATKAEDGGIIAASATNGKAASQPDLLIHTPELAAVGPESPLYHEHPATSQELNAAMANSTSFELRGAVSRAAAGNVSFDQPTPKTADDIQEWPPVLSTELQTPNSHFHMVRQNFTDNSTTLFDAETDQKVKVPRHSSIDSIKIPASLMDEEVLPPALPADTPESQPLTESAATDSDSFADKFGAVVNPEMAHEQKGPGAEASSLPPAMANPSPAVPARTIIPFLPFLGHTSQNAAASTQIKSQTEVGYSGKSPSIGPLNGYQQTNSDISNQPSWDSAPPFVVDSSSEDKAELRSDGTWKIAFVSLLLLVLLVSCVGIVVWQFGPRICPDTLSFLHWKDDDEDKMNLYEVKVDTDSNDGSEAFAGFCHDQCCDSGSTAGPKPHSKESSSADLGLNQQKKHKPKKTKGRSKTKAGGTNDELACRFAVDSISSGSDEVSFTSLVSIDRRGSCSSDISFMSSDVRGVSKTGESGVRAGRGDDVSSAETPDPDAFTEGATNQASEQSKGSKAVTPAPPSCPRPPKCTRSRLGPPSRSQQRPRRG